MVVKERWFWKLVAIFMAILLVPLVGAWLIMSMPPVIMYVSVVALLVLFCVVRGWRDWSAKKAEDSDESAGEG